MNIFYIIILGIIQGLTEFLPISSSGHLEIFKNLFGMQKGDLFLTLILHAGTLLAVLIFFYKEILNLFKSFSYKKNPTLYFIIIANIPTAIIGFIIEKKYSHLSSLWFIGIMLIFTAVILLMIKKFQNAKEDLTAKKSFTIGIAQGLAALPGISRSGSTIATSLFLKVKKEKAFAFSFIISIPAILGANLYKMIEISKTPSKMTIPIFHLICGFIAAFLVGWACLFILKKLIQSKKFHYFGYYCLIIGTATFMGGIL